MDFLIERVTKHHASEEVKYHALYVFYVLRYSKEQVAKMFGKSIPTVRNWIAQYEQNGIMTKTERKKTYRKFTADMRCWILELYRQEPILFLDEAKSRFEQHFGISIDVASICRILHAGGYSWKTIERRAIQLRKSEVLFFYQEITSFLWELHMLLFLDEISIDNRGILRTKGYSPVGHKIIHRGEFTRKARVSLLSFLGQDGIVETFYTEGTFDRAKFFQFCRELALSDKVEQYPGRHSVWVMDGARIHLDKNIVTYLRHLGIKVVFLPAYAPFYSPIEFIFGYAKKDLTRNHVENVATILPEVATVLHNFSDFDCTRLFARCGYKAGGVFDPAPGLGQPGQQH